MRYRYLALTGSLLILAGGTQLAAALSDPAIPLPEHPRPDFQRPTWLNLNGPWQFQFDPQNQGLDDKWSTTPTRSRRRSPCRFPGARRCPAWRTARHRLVRAQHHRSPVVAGTTCVPRGRSERLAHDGLVGRPPTG